MNRIGWKRASAVVAVLPLAACGQSDAGRADAPTAVEAPRSGGRIAKPGEQVRSVDAAGLIPPGAVIGSDSPAGDAIVITFQSREPPERLLAWYRSAQRGSAFRIGSKLQEGAEQVLDGSTVRPPGAFSVRLALGINGGTTAMIVITGP